MRIKKVLSEIKNKRFLLAAVLDVVFLIAIFSVGVLAKNALSAASRKTSVFYLIFLILYILAILFVYSAFKLIILRLLSCKKKACLKIIYLFNIIFALIICCLLIVLFSVVRYFVRSDYQKIYFEVGLFLLSVFGYLVLHLAHLMIFFGERIEKAFTVIRKNALWIMVFILFEGISLLMLVRGYYSTINSRIYNNIIFISIVFLAMFYNAINRIIFFHAAERV